MIRFAMRLTVAVLLLTAGVWGESGGLVAVGFVWLVLACDAAVDAW